MANIRIDDPLVYEKYLDRSEEIFASFKGRYLAVDQNPKVVEGNWDYGRAVLIQFNTREDFEAWYHSEDYQEILQLRLASADCDTILIHGS
jgi:uncharacterized protein (DUF1330 family)